MSIDAPNLAVTPARQRISPSTIGVICCLLSSIGYTAFNICLRGVSDCDPVLVNFVLASTCVVGILPFLIWKSWQGLPVMPPWREIAALAVLGLITQVGGVLFVFGLGSVGLAITAPLQTGIILLGSVVLGRMFLGEMTTGRSILACVLVTVSVAFFGMGADDASKAIQQNKHIDTLGVADPSLAAADPVITVLSPGAVWLAMGAACLSGVAFTILTFGIRKMVNSNTTPEAIVFMICVMGVVGLGPWAWQRLGLAGILATRPQDFYVMLGAGAFNLVSFTLITVGLKLTSLVRINAINTVATTALTAIAGILFFAEPATAAVLIGIVLTIAGILLVGFADEPSPA